MQNRFQVKVKKFRPENNEKFMRTGRWVRKTQYGDVLVESVTVDSLRDQYLYMWRIRLYRIAFQHEYPSTVPGISEGSLFETPERAAMAGMSYMYEMSKAFGAQPTARPRREWLLFRYEGAKTKEEGQDANNSL